MLMDLLLQRCSIRNFTQEPIPEAIINYILEAARLSPSGGNEQSWRFGVITDTSLISELAEAAYNQAWIKTSPLVIVLVTVIVDDERDGRFVHLARFPELKQEFQEMAPQIYASAVMEEHQTKIPGTHMVLAALEHGIYSTWISYFDVNKVSNLLGLPQHHYASEMIAFGYPAKITGPRKKKPLKDLVFYNRPSEENSY